MRKIILIMLLSPLFCIAQKQEVFIKLVDANGKQISGDAVVKGFEKQLYALTVGSAGKNNTQVTFSMTITGASADLKRAMTNGETLQSGMVTVTQLNPSMGRPMVVYSIKIEEIKVNACSESMGCNSAMTTSASITATRIGWTYYQNNPNGTQTVSRKYGFDSASGKEWTNF
jgi:type VI protein secretion system component Hcp